MATEAKMDPAELAKRETTLVKLISERTKDLSFLCDEQPKLRAQLDTEREKEAQLRTTRKKNLALKIDCAKLTKEIEEIRSRRELLEDQLAGNEELISEAQPAIEVHEKELQNIRREVIICELRTAGEAYNSLAEKLSHIVCDLYRLREKFGEAGGRRHILETSLGALSLTGPFIEIPRFCLDVDKGFLNGNFERQNRHPKIRPFFGEQPGKGDLDPSSFLSTADRASK
jgi:chromosome segregation ATPase